MKLLLLGILIGLLIAVVLFCWWVVWSCKLLNDALTETYERE